MLPPYLDGTREGPLLLALDGVRATPPPPPTPPLPPPISRPSRGSAPEGAASGAPEGGRRSLVAVAACSLTDSQNTASTSGLGSESDEATMLFFTLRLIGRCLSSTGGPKQSGDMTSKIVLWPGFFWEGRLWRLSCLVSPCKAVESSKPVTLQFKATACAHCLRS